MGRRLALRIARSLSSCRGPAAPATTFTETLTLGRFDQSVRRPTRSVRFDGNGERHRWHLQVDTPVLFSLNAIQSGGTGDERSSVYVHQHGDAVAPFLPEASTWVMMALGFGALGYAAIRQGKANAALLPSRRLGLLPKAARGRPFSFGRVLFVDRFGLLACLRLISRSTSNHSDHALGLASAGILRRICSALHHRTGMLARAKFAMPGAPTITGSVELCGDRNRSEPL